MYKIGVKLVLIIISFPCLAQNQPEFKVHMKEQNRWVENYPYTVEAMEVSIQKELYSVPKLIKGEFLIKEYDFNYLQSILKKYRKDSSLLNAYEKNRLFANPELKNKKKYLNSVAALLIYEDAIKRHFILDANMNKSFTDDKIFSFPKKNLQKVKKTDWHKYLIRQRIKIEFEENDKTIKGTPYVTIYPFASSNLAVTYSDSLSKKFPIMGCSWDHNTVGKISDGLLIYAKNNRPTKLFKENYTFFYIQKGDKILSHPYKANDIFDHDGQKYQIKSISQDGSYIYLIRVPLSSIATGYLLNFYIGETKLQRLNDDSIFILIPKDKKILLDFWGTWCGPCIALTPQLKMLYEHYKSHIEFVSVAVDDSVEKVKNYVSVNDMKWTNAIQSFSDSSKQAVLKQFMIGAYPTFILIDEFGKVIFREIGTEGFKKLEEFLKNKIKSTPNSLHQISPRIDVLEDKGNNKSKK